MLMQAKNAVGSNTPGAASSAADLEFQEAPESSPGASKIDAKNVLFFNIDFFGFRPRFWRVLGFQLGAKSAALRAAPGVLEPTAFYACIDMLLFLA